RDPGFTIHRIIAVRRVAGRTQVRTKGDALARADGWWNYSEVLGQVLRVYRVGRWVPLVHGWRYRLGWAYSWLSPLRTLIIQGARALRARLRLLRKGIHIRM